MNEMNEIQNKNENDENVRRMHSPTFISPKVVCCYLFYQINRWHRCYDYEIFTTNAIIPAFTFRCTMQYSI